MLINSNHLDNGKLFLSALFISLMLYLPSSSAAQGPAAEQLIISPPVLVNSPIDISQLEPIQVPSVPQVSDYDRAQLYCLAQNAYYEARGQSRNGMIAVTYVVMNRTKSSRFPNTPCGVIKQRFKNVCQFSWTCRVQTKIHEQYQYELSKEVAEAVYYNKVKDVSLGALFFHNGSANPSWAKASSKTISIGNHVFYRG